MLKKAGLFPLLLLVSGLAGAQNQTPDTNWAGTWKLNVSRSKMHAPAVKQETAMIPAIQGATRTVKFSINGMSADDKPINLSFDGTADGKPYPIMSGTQQIGTAAYQRQSSHHYTVTFDYTDGRKVSQTLVMAPNGKSFTVQSHTKTATEAYDETDFWEKQ